MTRRALVGSLALAATAQSQTHKEWKPGLGILGPFSAANLQFAREQGFTSMILAGTARSTINAREITNEQVQKIKEAISQSGLTVSALQASQNHIDPDAGKRAAENEYFVKLIAVAGKLGIPYIGTSSGKDPDPRKPFK